MRCARHDLAAGPDGKCVLCAREREAFERAVVRQRDRRLRVVTRSIVGVVAGIAAFALLLAVCDRAPTPVEANAPDAAAR